MSFGYSPSVCAKLSHVKELLESSKSLVDSTLAHPEDPNMLWVLMERIKSAHDIVHGINNGNPNAN